jgi:hypothetical protein
VVTEQHGKSLSLQLYLAVKKDIHFKYDLAKWTVFLKIVPSYYTFHYFSVAQNNLRHEYIEGAILSIFVGTWF